MVGCQPTNSEQSTAQILQNLHKFCRICTSSAKLLCTTQAAKSIPLSHIYFSPIPKPQNTSYTPPNSIETQNQAKIYQIHTWAFKGINVLTPQLLANHHQKIVSKIQSQLLMVEIIPQVQDTPKIQCTLSRQLMQKSTHNSQNFSQRNPR